MRNWLQIYPMLHVERHTTQTDLLKRKGVYPYDYMDYPKRLEETCLPPKSSFCSRLTDADISDSDYVHAQNVWRTLNLNTLGDYHDHYMKTDVLLLADIFERFRFTCLSHYYTSPGSRWDAMLKMTGVLLELFTDPDMHLFVENGIRGGVSMVSHKFSRANNPYTPDCHPEQPSKYILYLDCNNLYGGAMSKKLPISDFWWLNENEIDDLDVVRVPSESEIGYIMVVDMEYPTSIHDSHSDYPLAPANICIASIIRCCRLTRKDWVKR